MSDWEGSCRWAVAGGDLAALETALADGRDDLDQAMRAAAEKGRCDMIRLLLDHGVEADARSVGWARTALFAAANPMTSDGQEQPGYCHTDAAIMLLDAGADVNHSDIDGYTPLIDAALGGHLQMLRLLLRRGAKLDASFYVAADGMSFGGTAEAVAEHKNRHECVALLSGVRLAGGWKKWVSIPRKQLVVLRVLCERGRASTEDALLARLFPSNAPAEEAEEDDDDAASRARVAPRGEVPKEVFWHVLEYWQSSRD